MKVKASDVCLNHACQVIRHSLAISSTAADFSCEQIVLSIREIHNFSGPTHLEPPLKGPTKAIAILRLKQSCLESSNSRPSSWSCSYSSAPAHICTASFPHGWIGTKLGMTSHDLFCTGLTDRNQTSGYILASSTDRRAVEPIREFVLYGYGSELHPSCVP